MAQKEKKDKTNKRKKLSILRLVIVVILLAAFIGAGAAAGIVAAYIKDAPEISSEDILQLRQSSIVYEESTGEVVDRIHAEVDRTLVSLDDVPVYVQNAFIAIEDERFRQHFGIDIQRILGVIVQNLKARDIVAGASTITQQLVRNVVLTQEQKFKRKIQEQYLAIKLERVFTKDQILEAYLNTIYFGHSAYGIHAAAATYFGKNVSELSLAEGAMIAGVTNNPGIYSPYLHPDNAKKRQELVLKQMLKQGYISDEEYNNAVNQQLVYKKSEQEEDEVAISSYFIDKVKVDVREALMQKYHYSKDEANNLLFNGGLKIYSTIDVKMQETVEKVFKDGKNFPETKDDAKGVPQPQAAMVIIDYKTGKIKAMVGGRGQEGKLLLNRATQSYRQPGSAIKPITVYTAAIDNGYTAGTVVDDVPTAYIAGDGKLYIPKNWYTDSATKRPTYWGLSTVREAVQWSMNVIAVKVLDDIGMDTALDYAKRLGITSFVESGSRHDKNLASLALGGLTKGVSPIEMATAYGTLANGGVKVQPISYVRVEDANGHVILENKPINNRVVSEEVAYVLTDMMKSVVKAGTGTSANFNMTIAGKTGTTSDSVDAWFIGYTPYYVASVWIGHDEPKSMGFGGGSYPARLWRAVMEEVHKGLPVVDFPKPAGITTVAIDTESGKLPTDLSVAANTVRNEIFIKGTEPTDYDDVHVVADVDVTTNKLATPFCPPTLVESRIFIKRPVPYSAEQFLQSIGGADPKVHLIPRDAVNEVPTEYCPYHSPFGPPPEEQNGDTDDGETETTAGGIIDQLTGQDAINEGQTGQ